MRALLALSLLAACEYRGEFKCTQDEQCRGLAGGACELEGFCSMTDTTCASGRRYDDSAGAHADECVSGPTGCDTWQAHYFSACSLPPPSGNLSITTGEYTFDTTNGTMKDPMGIDIPTPSIVRDGLRIVSVQDFTIATNAAFRAIGDKPLVIAAWGSIEVAGKVDAGSHAMPGPGSNPPECAAIAPRPGGDGTMNAGGGGGGGGGFSTMGGEGGKGSDQGGAGGAAGGMLALPTTIQGGCSGAASGNAGPNATMPLDHATGGAGGGAIVLAARAGATISGTVEAAGQGGGGAPMKSQSGGGGGGAGGFIAIEGATIQQHGMLVATGGGGGGSAPQGGGVGGTGADGTRTGAAGGSVSQCSGAGGQGSSMQIPNGGNGNTGTCGGSGGGGGHGYIVLFTATLDATGAINAPAYVQNPF